MLWILVLLMSVAARLTEGTGPTATSTVGQYKLELYGGRKSFGEAQTACSEIDSWLVEIKTKEIEDANTKMTKVATVWIGLSYSTNEWKWGDGSSLLYSNWSGGSSPSPSSTPKCAIKSSSGKWSSSNCGEERKYVCQSDTAYAVGYLNVLNSSKNFADAKKACAATGHQSLVDVKTQELHDLIVQKIGNTGNEYWTSGNDLNNTDTWKWGDGTPIDITSKNWLQWPYNPEPNGPGEHCVAFTTQYSIGKGWTDVVCSNQNRYICQNKCGSGACLNDANCSVSDGRYNCVCAPGYFGNKCETDLITISPQQPDITVNKGEATTVVFMVQSYDGDVSVTLEENPDKGVTITDVGGEGVVSYSLGPQIKDSVYTIEAYPQSRTYSKNSQVSVTVVDRCDSSPCQNSGQCSYSTTSPYFTCNCTDKAFEGTTCSERKFVSNGNCQYHVYYDATRSFRPTHDEAKSFCTTQRGTLAMMKSAAIQNFVEDTLIDQYGENGNVIALWIGGHKPSDTWIWMDGTEIPISSGFQNWALDPGSGDKMLMSSWEASRDDLKWRKAPSTLQRYGVVCEKADTNDPCESLKCMNDGTCVAVGCQANCVCTAGYGGVTCETDLITLSTTKTVFFVNQGQNVTVTLEISSGDGEIKIEVSKDSFGSIAKTKRHVAARLVNITIGPLESQTPRETYQFRATPESNPGSYYRNTSVDIGVQGPPSIEDLSQRVLAIPTGQDDTAIACIASGFPIPNVTWKHEESIISTDISNIIYQMKTNSNSTLHITRNASSEVGYYTCYAKNILDKKVNTANASLFVTGKIQLVNVAENISEFPLNTASITCAFQGFPAPNITWKQELLDGRVTDLISGSNSNPIFSIESKLSSSQLVRRTSVLRISLPEYLGPVNITCLAHNEYETLSHSYFTLNSRLARNGNLSYLLYIKKDDRANFTEAEGHCTSVHRTLVKIPNSETQSLIADILTGNEVKWNVFIGGRRSVKNGSKLWIWPDDTVFYNESKNGPSVTGEAKIVDGNFVAWLANEPNSDWKTCGHFDFEKSWSWIDTDCSKAMGYICESTVAGIPSSFETTVSKCSPELTVIWKASREAMGIKHRVALEAVRNPSVAMLLSVDAIPQDETKNVNLFENLLFDTAYNVSITVCPDCPQPYTMSKMASTNKLFSAETFTFSEANTRLTARNCVLSWSVEPHEYGITGFKIKAYSSISQYVSSKYIRMQETSEYSTGIEKTYAIHPQPNRRYNFTLTVVTCQGVGLPVNVNGSCISDTAPPTNISSPRSVENNGDKIVIQTFVPDEANGPISCLFIIVVYKPTSSSKVTVINSKESLQKVASLSLTESLEPGDSYIAIAVKRSEIGDQRSLSLTLGNKKNSECDIKTKLQRSKTQLTDIEIIKAANRELEDDATYMVYSITTTPGEEHVWLKASASVELILKSTPVSVGIIAGVVAALIIGVSMMVTAVILVKRKRNSQHSGSDVNEGNKEEEPYETTFFKEQTQDKGYEIPIPSDGPQYQNQQQEAGYEVIIRTGESDHQNHLVTENPYMYDNDPSK